MWYFDWDASKNESLRTGRGVDFEAIVTAIREGKVLDDFPHPNVKKYPGQRVMVVTINAYAYLIPYVERAEIFFLKTIIPSRKATKSIFQTQSNIYMPHTKLDKEEKEIVKAFAQGRLKRSPGFDAQKKKLAAAAKNTLDKNRNVNIRISEHDLFRVKSLAARQGVPYQTLLTSLIHQYSNNQIDYNVIREPKAKYLND